MDTVTVRFTTRWPWNIGSWLVARLSGSRQWSHVMLIVGDQAFEASMGHGCRVTHVDIAMQGVTAYRDMQVPVADLTALVNFGWDQNGHGYDWAGALGIPFLYSDDWADAGTWWCSELVFAMLGAGGTWVLDPAEAKRVTPNDLHQCNFPKLPIMPATRPNTGPALGR